MENLVPLGTGNSRLMKSNIPASTTLAQLIQMLNNGTFPYDIGPLNSAGISQQGTPLNKATLFSDETKALYPEGVNNPNDAFEWLRKNGAGITATYPAAVAITAGDVCDVVDGQANNGKKALSDYAVGSIIQLNENGSPIDFYVAKHDYEPSLNGAGKTLLVRRPAIDVGYFDNSTNSWNGSNMHTYFIGTYFNSLDADVRSAINSINGTTYYYVPNPSSPSVSSMRSTVFALSLTELGLSESRCSVLGSSLPIASTLRRNMPYNNTTADQWTRTPINNGTTGAAAVSTSGGVLSPMVNSSRGRRPAFCLPGTFGFQQSNPTQAIALNSAAPGENVTLLFGGSAALPGAEAGTEILSDGIIGEVPVDGMVTALSKGIRNKLTQIYTGSYTGTGTYGSSNPNTLTFPFEPKLVFVILTSAYPVQTSYCLEIAGQFLIPWGISRISASSDTNGSGSYVPYLNFTYSGTSLSWYASMSSGSANATHQFNTSGASYSYVAIG